MLLLLLLLLLLSPPVRVQVCLEDVPAPRA
jgi:hypothetical protein